MFRHILVPIDGSLLSMRALEQALDVARDANARVTVLTVVVPFRTFSVSPKQVESARADYDQAAREEAAAILSIAQQKAQDAGVACEALQVERDHPYEAIIETAAQTVCDLIAMASHGRRGVSAVLLGSETVKVLTHSKTPVLVFR